MTAWKALNRIEQYPWLAEVIACLASVAYFIQALVYTHTRDSVLDEGAYLLKGYLFVSGEYFPFQPYGVLTNHMPFSFLIPGYFQSLFGPGLRTGRYYAVFIGLLFILGAWILVRRLGGRWWAAAILSTFAMSPMMIKVYSLAVSQGLVACLLVWTLVFVIGDDRSVWHILMGSFLAGITLMTRINMAPVLVFVIVYIFWRYGARKGSLAAFVGLLPVLWGHIQYYPEIMTLWVRWFPPDLTPFLSRWRFPGMNQIPEPGITLSIRLTSLFQGYRLHFVPLAGIITSWILWPKKWKVNYRALAILFSSLYAFFYAMHAWSTLGGSHCVYCFSWYQYFFELLALLVVVVTWRNWHWELSSWRKGIAWGFIVVVLFSLVFGYVFHFGSGVQTELDGIVDGVLTLQVPRLVNWKIESGYIELWGLFANKFGMTALYSNEEAYKVVETWLRVPFSLLIGGVILLVLWWIAGRVMKRMQAMNTDSCLGNRIPLVMVMVLLMGWILTPTGLMGPPRDSYDCDLDIIASYETAGQQLANQVPAGSKVFWWGGDTQAELLYLKGVDFYPALFNANFANREGDSDQLERYGLWNDELILRWAGEADVLLIEERSYDDWLADYVSSGEFDELEPIPEVGCRGGTSLHVYLRQP